MHWARLSQDEKNAIRLARIIPVCYFVFLEYIAGDPLINLRENLSLGAVEVAIINDEQFIIKRRDVHIIEIVAIIPTKIDSLHERLTDSSLDVCSIDGQQKVIMRNGKLIEIFSDIVPIIDAEISHASNFNNNSKQIPSVLMSPTPSTSKQANLPDCTTNDDQEKSAATKTMEACVLYADKCIQTIFKKPSTPKHVFGYFFHSTL